MSAPNVGTASRIDSAGVVTKLGSKLQTDEVVTEDDAKDPAKLARLLIRLLASVAALCRRFAPRHVVFDDIVTTADPTILIRLQHNFGGRVRWWVVDFQIIGANPTPQLNKVDASSDANTLVLASYSTSLLSVRVEEAG